MSLPPDGRHPDDPPPPPVRRRAPLAVLGALGAMLLCATGMPGRPDGYPADPEPTPPRPPPPRPAAPSTRVPLAPTRKATWLYACGLTALPSLRWGPSEVEHRVDGAGFHTSEERKAKLGDKTRAEWLRERGIANERMSKGEREATPLPFRDLLIEIARGARGAVAA